MPSSPTSSEITELPAHRATVVRGGEDASLEGGPSASGYGHGQGSSPPSPTRLTSDTSDGSATPTSSWAGGGGGGMGDACSTAPPGSPPHPLMPFESSLSNTSFVDPSYNISYHNVLPQSSCSSYPNDQQCNLQHVTMKPSSFGGTTAQPSAQPNNTATSSSSPVMSTTTATTPEMTATGLQLLMNCGGDEDSAGSPCRSGLQQQQSAYSSIPEVMMCKYIEGNGDVFPPQSPLSPEVADSGSSSYVGVAAAISTQAIREGGLDERRPYDECGEVNNNCSNTSSSKHADGVDVADSTINTAPRRRGLRRRSSQKSRDNPTTARKTEPVRDAGTPAEEDTSTGGGALKQPNEHHIEGRGGSGGVVSSSSPAVATIVPQGTPNLRHQQPCQASRSSPTNVAVPLPKSEHDVEGSSIGHHLSIEDMPSTATTTLTPSASPMCCEMLTFSSTSLFSPNTATSTTKRRRDPYMGHHHSLPTLVEGSHQSNKPPLSPQMSSAGGKPTVAATSSRRNSLAGSHSFGALSIKCVAPPSVLFAEVRRRRNQQHTDQQLHPSYQHDMEEGSAGSAQTDSVFHTDDGEEEEEDGSQNQNCPQAGDMASHFAASDQSESTPGHCCRAIGGGRVESYMADRGESSPASRQEDAMESPRSLFNDSGSHNFIPFGATTGNDGHNVISTIPPRRGEESKNHHAMPSRTSAVTLTSPQDGLAAPTTTITTNSPCLSSTKHPSPTTTTAYKSGGSRLPSVAAVAPLSFVDLEQEHDYLTASAIHFGYSSRSMAAVSREASGGGVIGSRSSFSGQHDYQNHQHRGVGGTPTSRQSVSYTNFSSPQRRRSRGGGLGSSTHAEYGTMVDSQRSSRSHSIASLSAAALVPPMSSTAMDARLRKRASILHLKQSSLNSSSYNSPRRATTTSNNTNDEGGINNVIFRPVPTPGSLHWHNASPPLRATDGSGHNDDNIPSSRCGAGGGYFRVRRGTGVSPTSASHAANTTACIGGHYFTPSPGALTPTSSGSTGLTRFPTRAEGGDQHQHPTTNSLIPISQEVPSLAGSQVESASVSATSPNFAKSAANNNCDEVHQRHHGRSKLNPFNLHSERGWSSVSDLLALAGRDGDLDDVAMSPSVASVRNGIHFIVRRQRQLSQQSLTTPSANTTYHNSVGAHRQGGASFSGSGSWIRAPATAVLQTSTSLSKIDIATSVAGSVVLPPLCPSSSSQQASASISPRGGAAIIDTTHPVYGASPVFRNNASGGGSLITVVDDGGGGNISALDIDIAFHSTASTSMHAFVSGAISPTAARQRFHDDGRATHNHNNNNIPASIMAAPNGVGKLWGSVSSMGNNSNRKRSPQSIVPPLSASMISLGKSHGAQSPSAAAMGCGSGAATASPSSLARRHGGNWLASDFPTATMNGLNSPSFNSKLDIVVSTAAAAAERLRANTNHAAALAGSTSLTSSAKAVRYGVGGALIGSTYSSSPSSTQLPNNIDNYISTPSSSCFTPVKGRPVGLTNVDPPSFTSPTLMHLSERLRASQWVGSTNICGGGVTRSSSTANDEKAVSTSGGGKQTNKSVVASAALSLAASLSANPQGLMSSKSLNVTSSPALITSTSATTRAASASSKGALVASVLHKLQRRPSLMLSLFLQDSYSTIHYTNFFGPRQHHKSSTRSPPIQRQGILTSSANHQKQLQSLEFNSQEITGIDLISMKEIVGDSIRGGVDDTSSWHPTFHTSHNKNDIDNPHQLPAAASVHHQPGKEQEHTFHDRMSGVGSTHTANALDSSSSPSADTQLNASPVATSNTETATGYFLKDGPPAFNWDDDALEHSLTEEQQPRFTSVTKPVVSTTNSSPKITAASPSTAAGGSRRHRETSFVTILHSPGDEVAEGGGAAYNNKMVAEDDDDDVAQNADESPFDGADEQLLDSRFVVSGRVLTHPSNPLFKVEHSDGIVRCVDNENGDLVICVGMVLLGWLEVVRELGAGSFGQVVLCKDLRTVLNCGFYYDLDQEETDHAYYQTTEEYLDVEVREGTLVAVKVISSDAAMEQQSYLEAQILEDLSLAAEMEESSALQQSQQQEHQEYGGNEAAAATFKHNAHRRELRGQYICKVLANGGTFGHHCIAMELYPTNLYEYMLSKDLRGLPLAEIRAISRHTLLALSLTHETGIVHCDVKPENIMIQPLVEGGDVHTSSRTPSCAFVAEEAAFSAFDAEAEGSEGAATLSSRHVDPEHVDAESSFAHYPHNNNNLVKSPRRTMIAPDPIKAILIDFSSSTREGGDLYDYIQSRYYRAPEVIVGVRYGGPMDVWSVGCVMAEMLLGRPLLPGGNNHQQLFLIEQMFGPLPDEMLARGRLTPTYYNTTTTSSSRERDEDNNKHPPPQQPDTPAYGGSSKHNGGSGGGGKSAVSWLDGSALAEDDSANHANATSQSPPASHSRRTNNTSATTAMSAVSMSTLTPSMREPLSATGSVRGMEEHLLAGTSEHFGDDLLERTSTTTTTATACASPMNYIHSSDGGNSSPTNRNPHITIATEAPPPPRFSNSRNYSLKDEEQYNEEQRRRNDGDAEEDEEATTCRSPYIPPPPPVQYLNYTTLTDNIINAEWTPGELEVPEEERSRTRGLLADLLCQMLTLDPSRRITVDQAIEHPFFQT